MWLISSIEGNVELSPLFGYLSRADGGSESSELARRGFLPVTRFISVVSCPILSVVFSTSLGGGQGGEQVRRILLQLELRERL